MENPIENADSLNGENDTEVETDVETEDVNALREKVNELSGKNRQLFERAKKAEGFEKNDEGRWVKTQKPEAKPEPTAPQPQSNEPDYAKLAFLETKGIAHPDDQKIVQDEASRLKLPLTDVLQMEHIKSRLAAAKDQREAMAGMPKGRGNTTGKTQNDVDYWIAKGETPDDLELGNKVIEARISKEKNRQKFSDELYSG